MLLADEELLVRTELAVHELSEGVDTRQLTGLHLLACQGEEMIVAFLLLIPVADLHLGVAQLRECPCQVYSH